MKRITGAGMRMGEARVLPAPFPGKWPTRWNLRIERRRDKGIVWQYIGKPNAVAWAELVKRAKAFTPWQHENLYAVAQEFDRQNIVAQSYQAQIVKGGFYNTSFMLYTAYHFWDKGAEGFGWINTPHKIATINTGKGGMRVYIPAKIDMFERKRYREAFGA